ncbi:hypothetical protein BDN70DRAFT_344622 [Pholiota conissans]|uniref:Heterokaryon incompatibility domain-containing protein n=1 Tax=Pholiota conissans TaxID=109636 RepID=A0A9P5YSZ7_9AGAR|nr:hypothetical protein BDN70DRAFT_344622 [Pholiota conissans]
MTLSGKKPSSSSLLLDALESIIIPVIQAHSSGIVIDSIGENRRHLESAVRQLTAALETFVEALLQPSLIQEADVVTELKDSHSDILHATTFLPENGSAYTPLPPPPRPRLLRLAIDEARHRVFNKIPIRLLAFKPDGTGITLLERDEIWERVFPLLEANFYQDAVILDKDFHRGKEDSAIKHFISKHVNYAILSHTWISSADGEVVYADWKNGAFNTSSPGYKKLANFCRVAAVDHKVTLGWMDTVCINKENSTELDESIRSMYKWYSDADICITYLGRTATLEQMHNDAWFTRGWTLQELLAPRYVKFYDSTWQILSPGAEDDRNESSIRKEIQAATTITPSEIYMFRKASYRIPISRRMQWAANRHVKREEDIAYSLMGVFDISMSIAYGEGSERAFFRLVKKILKSTKRDALDAVNWGFGQEWRYTTHHPSALIPSSPRHYLWRTKEDVVWFPHTTPITLTHLGLHLPALLMPAVLTDSNAEDVRLDPIGNYYSTTTIVDAIYRLESDTAKPKTFKLLDKASKRSNSISIETPTSAAYQRTFGVLNFSEQDKNIFLPDGYTCFAICLYPKSHSGNFERMPTSNAVSFTLRQVRATNGHIPKSELARHGMQLVTMYL